MNAKELALGKINATSDTASMISALTVIGIPIEDVIQLLTSDEAEYVFRKIDEMNNIFSQEGKKRSISDVWSSLVEEPVFDLGSMLDNEDAKGIKGIITTLNGFIDFDLTTLSKQNLKIKEDTLDMPSFADNVFLYRKEDLDKNPSVKDQFDKFIKEEVSTVMNITERNGVFYGKVKEPSNINIKTIIQKKRQLQNIIFSNKVKRKRNEIVTSILDLDKSELGQFIVKDRKNKDNLYSFIKWYKEIGGLVDNKEKVKNIEYLIKFSKLGDEFGFTGRLLGLNGGLPNSAHSLYSYIKGLENFVNTKYKEKLKIDKETSEDKVAKIKALGEDMFDFNKFITNEEYRNKQLMKYDYVKEGFNVLYILSKPEHYQGYLKLLNASQKLFKTTTYKFANTENIINSIQPFIDKQGSDQKVMDDVYYNRVQDFVDGLLIDSFFNGKGTKDGKRKYWDLEASQRLIGKEPEERVLIELNSVKGRQDFLLTVEELIGSLKKMPKFKDNKFIQELVTESDKDRFNGQIYTYYRLKANMTEIGKETNVQGITYIAKLKDDFGKLAKLNIGNMSFGEIMFYYSLITSKGRNSSKSFSKVIPMEYKREWQEAQVEQSNKSEMLEFSPEQFILRTKLVHNLYDTKRDRKRRFLVNPNNKNAPLYGYVTIYNSDTDTMVRLMAKKEQISLSSDGTPSYTYKFYQPATRIDSIPYSNNGNLSDSGFVLIPSLTVQEVLSSKKVNKKTGKQNGLSMSKYLKGLLDDYPNKNVLSSTKIETGLLNTNEKVYITDLSTTDLDNPNIIKVNVGIPASIKNTPDELKVKEDKTLEWLKPHYNLLLNNKRLLKDDYGFVYKSLFDYYIANLSSREERKQIALNPELEVDEQGFPILSADPSYDSVNKIRKSKPAISKDRKTDILYKGLAQLVASNPEFKQELESVNSEIYVVNNNMEELKLDSAITSTYLHDFYHIPGQQSYNMIGKIAKVIKEHLKQTDFLKSIEDYNNKMEAVDNDQTYLISENVSKQGFYFNKLSSYLDYGKTKSNKRETTTLDQLDKFVNGILVSRKHYIDLKLRAGFKSPNRADTIILNAVEQNKSSMIEFKAQESIAKNIKLTNEGLNNWKEMPFEDFKEKIKAIRSFFLNQYLKDSNNEDKKVMAELINYIYTIKYLNYSPELEKDPEKEASSLETINKSRFNKLYKGLNEIARNQEEQEAFVSRFIEDVIQTMPSYLMFVERNNIPESEIKLKKEPSIEQKIINRERLLKQSIGETETKTDYKIDSLLSNFSDIFVNC